MRKLAATCLISLVLLFSLIILSSGPITAQAPDPPPAKGSGTIPPPPTTQPGPPAIQIDRSILPKIEPQLLKKLLQTNGGPVPFIVYLKAKADVAAAAASAPLRAQGQIDIEARRTAIVTALQQTAGSSQGGVLQALSAPASTGGISGQTSATDIRPLWIVNAVAAKGRLATVLAMAVRDDVEVIRLDKEVTLDDPIIDLTTSACAAEDFEHRLTTCPLLIPALQTPQWNISKIRADLVHDALGFDGSGVVVANIDTGVDWQHSALQAKYRGYTGPGKLPQHTDNWHDATGDGSIYPVDGSGHGTHTMGTMVGDNGVGVAPGAQWIAVRAFNSAGSGQNSWIHAAFQWVLAPNGNPALAPDIVNNSWGNNVGENTEFQADVLALLNAGIYPVFSAGNNGSAAGTVGSPGSFDISFAVGATTIDDEIADFSSRGPSPWGKIKPDVSAPGKGVVSTYPGGAYASLNGTSMAAPHASGLAALLLQVDPALSNNLDNISAVIKTTAVPLGSPIPNNDYGSGRIDAYNAVMAVASVGTMQGAVTQAGNGAAINGATIQITPHSGGPTINTLSNASGAYLHGLASNTYDATASAFGYEAATAFGLVVITGATVTRNFSLTSKATGTLAGTVKDKNTNAPLAAIITIDGTPANASTNPGNGSYNLTLPIGTYSATVVAAQHRVAKVVNVTINDGATVVQNFLLDSAPTILLVDSGKWYQESHIGFYQQALDALLYPYDTWQITQPFADPDDVPTAEDLANYDIVIWSAPDDSPGYIQADAALAAYLDDGGKLLLSGQDIAYFDGGGSSFSDSTYFQPYLKARFVRENTSVESVTGIVGEPFDGLSLSIQDGDGADNQTSPDSITIIDEDFASSMLAYNDGAVAGFHVGLCVPYRVMMLPFGFEAINSQTGRVAAMERAIDWLMTPPAAIGVELVPTDELLIGNLGTVVSHTVRLRNTGAGPDLYTLTLGNGIPYNWPVNPSPASTVSLASCASQDIHFGVLVNTTNTWHISDTLTLTAQSSNNPALTDVATRTTKSPAPVLLVDDGRTVSFANEFKEALAANNIPYDYWFVPRSWVGPTPPSPPLATLEMYPMVVWYNANDWFNPLITPEEDRLAAYLDGGGRLQYSGQDYIYGLPQHQPSSFASTYLGILSHTEDFSSTTVVGRPDSAIGAHLGPYALSFPLGYSNWTDALTPTATAQIITRGQANQPNGLIQAGIGPGGDHWHTTFLSFGPELLTSTPRARLMQRSLGWLSWLGRSQVTPQTSTLLEGSTVLYTAVITNDGWYDLQSASFTATFPTELTPGAHSPELSPTGGNLVWSGPLARNQNKVFTYTVSIAGSLPLGTVISQTSWLAYPDHNILFDRAATINVNFPDLSTSEMNVNSTQDVEPGDVLSYTVVLRNTGLVDAPQVTTTNTLPHNLEFVSIDTPDQGTVISNGDSFTWTTSLAKDEVTLTYHAVISYETSSAIQNTAYASDAVNEPVPLTARTSFKVQPIYLPFIAKK